MNRQAAAKELVAIVKSLQGSFVDQPFPLTDDRESELERAQAEAEEKLRKELVEVKNRYYWEPGRSTMINITLTGRPLFEHYTISGLRMVGYRDGVLVVNPQWVSENDSLPSYKWGFVVDKMIREVKQSEPIDRKIGKTLDKVEQKLGRKIDTGVRRDIIRWCERVAKSRLSVRAYPGPKGKEFVIFSEDAGMQASSRTAGLSFGQTIENENVRIHRYRPSVEITDLTNAGKRGKRCKVLFVYDLDYTDDAGGLVEDMVDALSRARNYEQASRIVEKGLTAINAVSRYSAKMDERLVRGVDVSPGGFKPIEIHGQHVYVQADFDSFTVRDKDDHWNEPTCIPSGSGSKTAVKMFYRWAMDNESLIKRGTFHEVTESMSKAGIRYHYYCAVD